MIGDLFDSPWKILIVAVVLIVLFGSKKLPDAARSLGKSMRILKNEVGGLHHDESDDARANTEPAAQFPSAELTSAPAPVTAPAGVDQTQLDALQQQIRDLQRAAAMDTAPAGVAAEPQRTQQSS
jgi:sec-independent protein translocase protein TatA